MNAISSPLLDLQSNYNRKRSIAAKTILQICSSNNNDRGIVEEVIYAILSFKDKEYIAEMLGMLVKSQKTDLLNLTLEHMDKHKFSATTIIDYIRPLDEDSRKQILTVLGIYKKNKKIDPSELESEVNAKVNSVLEWFYYNDPSRDNKILAGKYINVSKGEACLLSGTPCIAYFLIMSASVISFIGSVSGFESGFFDRLGKFSATILCISPLLYYPIFLLLKWSRSKPVIHNILIAVLLLLILILLFETLRAT